MLSCEKCNYIKTAESRDSKEKILFCELTGFVFHEKVEDYEMEYHPCYDYKIENNEIKVVKPELVTDTILKSA